MTDTRTATEAERLLHLVDRAEAGRLLPAEAAMLRAGVQEFAARLDRLNRARRGQHKERRRMARAELDDE